MAAVVAGRGDRADHLVCSPGRRGTGEQVFHAAPPVFNLLYSAGALRVAKPRQGELMRLEGRRGKLSVEVVVRPLELPPYRGDVTHGLLPAYADRFIEAQRRTPGVALAQEGRARVNNAVGYEIGFAGGAGRHARLRAATCCSCPTIPRRARAS